MHQTDDIDSWASAGAEAPGAAAGPRWTPPPAGAPRTASSRRLLLAMAATPWLVVGLLLLRPVAAGPDTPAPTGPTADPAPTGDPPPTPAVAAPVPVAPMSAATAVVGAGRDDRLGAVALMVVHASLGGPTALALPGIGGGDDTTYVDHAVVERVVHPHADAAVVVVLATVLGSSEGQWSQARRVRVAVPLVFVGPDPVPAGDPWPLGDWSPTVSPVSPVLVDDPDLHDDVVAAAERAGYRETVVESVGTSDAWALVADLTARGPGDVGPRSHRVWLEPDGDGLRLAGWRPTTASAPSTPSPIPTTTESP